MMPRLRISILCADVSRNAFGRAYVLARVLARTHKVQIIGPQFGASVWPPLAGLSERTGIEVIAVPAAGYPLFARSAVRLWRALSADLVYALKPYPTSFGLGLLYSRAKRIPLLLDIDDWEMGAFRAKGRSQLIRSILRGIRGPNNYLWLLPLARHIQRSDAITVSSTFLQRLYGGTVVPHGRDTEAMDPACVTGEEARRRWNLVDRSTVMFLGTPRRHKGIEDLIAAVERVRRPEIQCVIVGIDRQDPYTRDKLCPLAAGNSRVSLLPMQPFDQIPELLAAADVVVVPQRETPFTAAQVPAKLFDAMAMGRPIVSTAVSDIPQILDGCGLVVPPGDPTSLAEAIVRLLDSPALAAELSAAARAKCERYYSWDAMDRVLQQVIEGVS
jgi:glycosyltransferase involved in cell wall biosynthesis